MVTKSTSREFNSAAIQLPVGHFMRQLFVGSDMILCECDLTGYNIFYKKCLRIGIPP